MKETGVTKVNLRCFDLALRDVFMPRLELPDHKGTRENIKIGAHRLVRQPHGPG